MQPSFFADVSALLTDDGEAGSAALS